MEGRWGREETDLKLFQFTSESRSLRCEASLFSNSTHFSFQSPERLAKGHLRVSSEGSDGQVKLFRSSAVSLRNCLCWEEVPPEKIVRRGEWKESRGRREGGRLGVKGIADMIGKGREGEGGREGGREEGREREGGRRKDGRMGGEWEDR
jgi:hypothetical protein